MEGLFTMFFIQTQFLLLESDTQTYRGVFEPVILAYLIFYFSFNKFSSFIHRKNLHCVKQHVSVYTMQTNIGNSFICCFVLFLSGLLILQIIILLLEWEWKSINNYVKVSGIS